MKFGAHIQVPLRMNFDNLSDPLPFHLAPPSGQNFVCPILWFMTKHLQNKQHFHQPQLNFVFSAN